MQITRAGHIDLLHELGGHSVFDLRSHPIEAESGIAMGHMDAVGLVGLNYRSAGLDVRGRAALNDDRCERFLQDMKSLGVGEAVVVSTCNRTEIYSVGARDASVVELFARYAGMDRADLARHLYSEGGLSAVRHLFEVASGLDSAVLGETEIVSQLKQARQTAVDAGSIGSTLELLFARAIEASKRVRTETDLCRNPTSVGSLAVREAERRAGDLGTKHVLVLGSGQIAERVGKELRAAAASDVVFLNRSPERAHALADRLGFRWGALTLVEEEMARADVVFATTSAPHPIICQKGIEKLMQTRQGKPMVAVDLGVPNNVDPEVCVSGVDLVNMDSLAPMCATNRERREASIPRAQGILDEELERARQKLIEREAADTIKSLVDHADSVRERTLEWAFGKLKDLDDRERRVVEDLARRLVLGMIEPPMERLKSGDVSAAEREAIERLYRREGDS